MKKFKYLLISILLNTHLVYGFSLNSNTGRGFSDNEIDVYVADTDCSGAGFTTERYNALIKSAVKRFWNNVPTSALYLDVKGIRSDIDIDGDDHDAAILKTPKNSILAGCNDSADQFDNGSILGSAKMACSGSTCRAVLILNAHANSNLPDKDESVIEDIIAHELGHAFGLGHSKLQHNLMYYSVSGKFQKWLGQDDIDGVTYLYPHESELDVLGISLLGNCGSISTGGNEPPFKKSFLLGFIIMLILTGFLKMPLSMPYHQK